MPNDRLEREFTDAQSKDIVAGYTVYSDKVRLIIEAELSRKITEQSKDQALKEIARKSNAVFVMTQNEINKKIPEAYKFGLEWADNSAINSIDNMANADIVTKLEVQKEILKRKNNIKDQTLARKNVVLAVEDNIVMQKKITKSIIQNTGYGELHNEAIKNLIGSSINDFKKGLEGVTASASRILSEAQTQQIRSTIAESQLTKTSIYKIKNEVLKNLADQGFTTIATRDGKNMPIKWYAEMLSRTETIKTANIATINRGAELGINIVQFSEHMSSCDICIPYEGLLYDLTGVDYPYPLEPPLHPNCRHILILRPDLSI
jgi:hypothetical protein